MARLCMVLEHSFQRTQIHRFHFSYYTVLFKRNYYRPKPDVYKAHIRIIVIHPPIEKHLVVLTN